MVMGYRRRSSGTRFDRRVGGGIMREVVVVSAVRTAVGTFGGSLKDVPPTQLGAAVVREALARAQVDGKEVGHVVFGNVIHTEPRDMYLSRVAALEGGVREGAPCLTVNRLCGSGLQAVISAAQTIVLGDADIAIGGGAESMSRGAYSMPGGRWGTRMGDAKIVDMMVAALHDPFHNIHMGVTAENIATKWNISREQQDQLAVESHRRASAAIKEGRFKSQKGELSFDTDEHVRHDASLADMAKLRPVFAKENGTVTAGNASGINDGASALVLMERTVAERRGV